MRTLHRARLLVTIRDSTRFTHSTTKLGYVIHSCEPPQHSTQPSVATNMTKKKKDDILNKKNEKWIRLFEKFDPEGVGRISTEDFLLAINSPDFRQDPRMAKKRAALKAKVLDYGTSFITIEEFVQVMTVKPKLSELLSFRSEMPSAYQNYLYHLSGDLYRPHQYHEDLISRHRQILAKTQIVPAERRHGVEAGGSHQPEVVTLPSSYTLVSSGVSGPTSHLPSPTSPTGNIESTDLQRTPFEQRHLSGPLCSHHAIHFQHYDENDYSHYKSQSKSSPRFFGKIVRTVAEHFLSDEHNRKYYADMYSCMPPPFFILAITLIELIFFTYYAVINKVEVTTNGPIPIDSLFIFRPDKKNEVWRFFLYMVLHAGWLHLIFNLLVQLLVGLPLEMVHGSARIGAVYMSGVLAGSLATSVFDSEVYLVGASGGVYALLAAHLANVLLNYNHIELGLLRLIGILIVASVDVGIAVYNRYCVDLHQGSVSYVAHLAGALAGLSIGLLVLKNFEQKLHEQLMWWVVLGVYVACIVFALVFNIFY